MNVRDMNPSRSKPRESNVRESIPSRTDSCSVVVWCVCSLVNAVRQSMICFTAIHSQDLLPMVQ